MLGAVHSTMPRLTLTKRQRSISRFAAGNPLLTPLPLLITRVHQSIVSELVKVTLVSRALLARAPKYSTEPVFPARSKTAPSPRITRPSWFWLLPTKIGSVSPLAAGP